MTVLLANYEIILVLILLVIFVVIKAKQFLTYPSDKRQELILLWLVEAVALAEKRYGSGTGKIKLSMVYSMFVKKFGILATLVSQEVFENLVNKALAIVNETLKDELEKK